MQGCTAVWNGKWRFHTHRNCGKNLTWHILLDFHGKWLPITKHPTRFVLPTNSQGLSFTSPLQERMLSPKHGKRNTWILNQNDPQSYKYKGQAPWLEAATFKSIVFLSVSLRLKALHLYAAQENKQAKHLRSNKDLPVTEDNYNTHTCNTF